MITAPFNFVPLSEKVFFPDWNNNGKEVSHDIPFEDSQSGVIDITITAKSPIFVRNHSNDKTNPSTEFCNYNGQYYIPSSSVKGMVRSVLEILSFSKMSQFNDDTYAVRDLRNRELYMSKMTPDKTFCGWLQKKGDKYIIEDCGKPGRIRQEEIGKVLDVKFAENFREEQFKKDLKNKSKNATSEFIKTAKYKYELLKNKELLFKFKALPANNKIDKREIYEVDTKGKEGTIVLTGQASGRKNRGKLDAKIYEFIFFSSINKVDVEEEVFKKFKFAYFDGESNASEDWKWRKKQLDNNEKIPVFFQKKEGKIEHIGLSYLYKLPYKHSVKDGIYDRHKNNKKLDLVQTIFGFTDIDKALKGRVQFSHFKAKDTPVTIETKHEILGTPRASYYPIYVKQNPNNLFTTFMDDGFSIAGWKRYPVQCGLKSYPAPVDKYGKVNQNVGTTFTPLEKGTVFSGKLRYHNLTKAELGALLSALTFHNTQNCFHNIGMAKSLGYGKIKLEVQVTKLEEYLKAFELNINEQIENWHNQKQLLELLTMATEQEKVDSSIWDYMSLTQFTDHKKRGQEECLNSYSEFKNITKASVKSLISKEELNAVGEIRKELEKKVLEEEKEYKKELMLKEEEKKKREKIEKEQRAEEEKKALQIKKDKDELDRVLNSDNIQILQNFIEKYPEHEKIDEIKSKKDAIENANKANKHKEVNEKFDRAYEALQKKKGNQRQYGNYKGKFVEKWSKSKENKGSEYILELIKGLK